MFAIFLFPETLFSRDPAYLSTRTQTRTYHELLFDFRGNALSNRSLHFSHFLESFYMLRYPSILFPFWYYTWAWTFINVLPAISIANIYTRFYNLKSGPIGACLGVSLMIGSLLGEFSAGKASDSVMYRMARRNGNIRKPEYRLYLSCLSALFMPAGLIIFGATVGKTHHFIPLIGLAIGMFTRPFIPFYLCTLPNTQHPSSSQHLSFDLLHSSYLFSHHPSHGPHTNPQPGVFGLQIASTTLYAYVSDCYKPQTPETGVLFNLSRGLSFVIGYFALPFADKAGFAWAWFTFAVVLFAFFVPVGTLIWWGEGWREKGGRPGFHGWL